MDSIGDNVTTIICVVVGVLIIGCALIPIVDNAGTEEVSHTTETSGFNSIEEGLSGTLPTWWLEPVDEVTVTTDGSAITMNGQAYDQEHNLFMYPTIGSAYLAFVNYNTKAAYVNSSFDGTAHTLASATIEYSEGTVTITGTTSDSQTYTGTKQTDTLFVTAVGTDFAADPTEVYGVTASPITIGSNQYIRWGSTAITMETETLPTGMTKTVNEDGTATFTFSSGHWCGPYKWTGSITTTTTEESEYAGLYNMIPVLCILGMAYVLIRRFY